MSGVQKESYKGVRDFYPEDQAFLQYLFKVMRKVCLAHGFEEMNASILEPTELYANKTSEEIVSEQTYTFEDRGGRSVTLRPEMTPSVARMVAQKRRELSYPLRWFSIGPMYRYERPQRGRLREHFQLNADIFGGEGLLAEIEVISVASSLLGALGARSEDYVVRINDRRLMRSIFMDCFALPPENQTSVLRLLDRKSKMDASTFDSELDELLGERSALMKSVLSIERPRDLIGALPDCIGNTEWIDSLSSTMEMLSELSIPAQFDPSLARGFDYYTGTVFEIFDTNPENSRSLFGGGRYDNLMELFEEEHLPAVGIAAGDVTLKDFLVTHNLFPDTRTVPALYICTLSSDYSGFAFGLAQRLREQGHAISVNIINKKVGDQITYANKQGIPYIICIGESEVSAKTFSLKKLSTGEETRCTEETLPQLIMSS